ncbi:MAG: energy-coupling factor transporter ATPase [Clostridiales bacterium]|nr:energy-coupling factor transporter ATPase [Clostridiales bacterium]
MPAIVQLKNVSYAYRGETFVPAVKNVSLEIGEGVFAALCGQNGSGKSTLARLMNGLLTPDEGDVIIGGIPLGDEKKTETVNGVAMPYDKRLYEIRRSLGIVFQNPDNQTVAAVIEDDIAFGPENIGVPTAEIRERVDAALKSVGMSEYAERTASRLSGGQKQRIAIAGILALKPRVIVLDESTAMLDPKGRAEVLDTVRRLNRDEGITIVLITHFMEEAALADQIYVMNEGGICLSGGREIFWKERAKLREIGLKAPPAAELAERLRAAGVPVPEEVCSETELADALCFLPCAERKAENTAHNSQFTIHNAQLKDKDNAQCNGHFSLSQPVIDCPAKENSPAKKEKSVGELSDNAEFTMHNAQLKDGVINAERNGDEKNTTETVDCGLCTVDCKEKSEIVHCELCIVNCPPVIDMRELSFSYSPGTAFSADALKEVTLSVREGDFLGVIGHTGSGKSTLAQHLNGLIKMQTPTRRQRRRGVRQGTLHVFGMDLSQKKLKPNFSILNSQFSIPPGKLSGYKILRGLVGMVFQYPEYQLFDETVLKDVGFGPRNLGLPADEIAERCKWAIEAVGLDYGKIKDMSPFELSGGQKRRAAIAGVIAMKPKVLILDEPTAGLDPKGREEIMELILKIKAESCPTIVMISHDMDEIARRCNRILVLNGGRAEFDLPPAELYARHAERLTEIGLALPLAARLGRALNARGFGFPAGVCNEDEFVREAARLMDN